MPSLLVLEGEKIQSADIFAINNLGQLVIMNSRRLFIYDKEGTLLVDKQTLPSKKHEEGMHISSNRAAINMQTNEIIFADRFKDIVFILNEKGDLVKKFGGQGSEQGHFNRAEGVCVGQQNGDIYVCDKHNHRIQIFDSQGGFKRSFLVKDPKGALLPPKEIFLLLNGNVLILCGKKIGSYDATQLLLFDSDGVFMKPFLLEKRFHSEPRIAVDGAGHVLVVPGTGPSSSIFVYNDDGDLTNEIVLGGIMPRKIAVHPHFGILFESKRNIVYLRDVSLSGASDLVVMCSMAAKGVLEVNPAVCTLNQQKFFSLMPSLSLDIQCQVCEEVFDTQKSITESDIATSKLFWHTKECPISKSIAFRNAVLRGDFDFLVKLSKEPDVDFNRTIEVPLSAFHYACRDDGRTEFTKFLLGLKGVDVNLLDNFGKTPFLWACNSGNIEAVKLLLRDPRIKINEPSNDNETPLWLAASKGYAHVVALILMSGRQVDTKTVARSWNTTAAQVARRFNYNKVAVLIDLYESDPKKFRQEMKAKVSGRLFALVVYFSGGYLQPEEKEEKSKEVRFFSIARRLPIELQMLLCHRVYGSLGAIVKTKHSEPAFQNYAKE